MDYVAIICFYIPTVVVHIIVKFRILFIFNVEHVDKTITDKNINSV